MRQNYFLLICFSVLAIVGGPILLSPQPSWSEGRGKIGVWGQPLPPITDEDLQVIEFGDVNSTSWAVERLHQLFSQQGKEVVEAAVPALVNRATKLREERLDRIQRGISDPGGEGKAELELHIVQILIKIGDIRAKSLLLASPQGIEGLASMGPSVIPDLVSALDSPDALIRTGAADTLLIMAKQDPSIFPEETVVIIRTRIVALLRDEVGWVRRHAIEASGMFGDASIIPELEWIAQQDPYLVAGKPENRIKAIEALKKLRARYP
ncbi:MAG: HEAT repeat domain-containing protein [Chloroflexi bacterium]|nr:HEAT repeat domain-containing protein [Chloroflexota bacterium]